MTQRLPINKPYDMIGVGFGPSNLALAIALEEQGQACGRRFDNLFLDRQANYRWHGDTLVSQSELQISFLKDLVSMRNPTSRYSFVNYLHQQGRLVDFSGHSEYCSSPLTNTLNVASSRSNAISESSVCRLIASRRAAVRAVP